MDYITDVTTPALNASMISDRAKNLLREASLSNHPYYGFSTTSCQIYDTAWLAMVAKPVDGQRQWLFPECFQYLLGRQSADGGWSPDQSTQTAGILDTSAALLALLKHQKEPLQISEESTGDIQQRTSKASKSLQKQLESWNDMLTANHIGLELILPSLLEYIEAESPDLQFDFACKPMLMNLNAAKMLHFKSEDLYHCRPSSALHSLEAFIGKVDFDRISHHLMQGSMMASPSSTAAYLIYSTIWDTRAESYLRHVMSAGSGKGGGGVPGTFPTTYFEYSWIISTLIRAGFSRSELDCPELENMKDVLVQALTEGHGLIGFAPHIIDVDDTAKALIALQSLGDNKHLKADRMIKMFEADEHFLTFVAERDPSITSNCHVLIALLAHEGSQTYACQVEKAVKFLCRSWWSGDSQVRDKWHQSHLYPTMLLVQAFGDLMRAIEDKKLSDCIDLDLCRKVSICLFQACSRTLLQQETNGSWGDLPEQTAYATLTLCEAYALDLCAPIRTTLFEAVKKASRFLQKDGFAKLDHSWTSKTVYRVSLVADAYEIAALKSASLLEAKHSTAIDGEAKGVTKVFGRLAQLFRQTPLLKDLPDWEVDLSLIESGLFVPILRMEREKVFTRDTTKLTPDTYLDIIPLTWVICNNRTRAFVSSAFLWDMMLISLLGYQVDEFFEATVAHRFDGRYDRVYHTIDRILRVVSQKDDVSLCSDISEDLGPQMVSGPLFHFILHVLRHPAVLAASVQDRQCLERELKAFLYAHTRQMEDNTRLRDKTRRNSEHSSPSERPFFEWVRTTGADHVACAYSLAFASCLLSTSLANGQQLFPTLQQTYLASAVSRHLATMCRMYNDYGSLVRDTEENNLNSMHFPEFEMFITSEIVQGNSRKKMLSDVAEYEHDCLKQSLNRLEREVLKSQHGRPVTRCDERKLVYLQFFCDVTDLYDQLYVVRDLSSSIDHEKTTAHRSSF